MPIITICPTKYDASQALKEFGYGKIVNLIRGRRSTTKTSWGQQDNLTFEGLLDNVFSRDIIEKIVTKRASNYRIVYIPRYGYCKEISNYTTRRLTIEIRTPNVERMRIFISDPNFRSYFNPDYTSQLGIPIIVEENEIQYLDVKVKVISSCQVRKTDIPEKNKFKQCVDDELQSQIGEILGCVPPWMSSQNQCNGTYPSNFTKAIPNYASEIIPMTHILQNLELETKCHKFCSAIKSTVQLREKYSLRLPDGSKQAMIRFGLFSIAPCKVFTLYFLCLNFLYHYQFFA